MEAYSVNCSSISFLYQVKGKDMLLSHVLHVGQWEDTSVELTMSCGARKQMMTRIKTTRKKTYMQVCKNIVNKSKRIAHRNEWFKTESELYQ